MAFTRPSQRTYGYIDPVGKYLIVDATSDARADDFTGIAATERPGVPARGVSRTQERPASVMTEWVARGTAPDDIELGQEGELVLPVDMAARLRNQNSIR